MAKAQSDTLPSDQTIQLLSKLVQIEEYRAEIERARLEKDGLRFPPFRYKE